MFSTCDSKMKSEMEIQQDAVTLWLEMIGILKDMAKSYETGECLNGEE